MCAHQRWVPIRRYLTATATAFALMGCNHRNLPRPADPGQSRASLCLALDTWRRGESAERLRERRPSILVVDHEWRSGLELTRYELVGDAKPWGTDRRYEVRLWLRNQHARAKARMAPKLVAYSVGTDPALTVVREDR